VELAIDRVRTRVREGGHDIPKDVIERRYAAGIKNLFKLYCNRVDFLFIYDNSSINSVLIAEKEGDHEFIIHNKQSFNQLKMTSNE
jgi:predicted ABC-type ATPase